MDAARCLSLLRRWWWLPVLGSLMAVAAYGAASLVSRGGPDEPLRYRATASLIVSLRRDAAERPADVVDRPWDLDRLMATYAELIASDRVAERAASELGVPEQSDALRRSIDVATPGYTQVLYVHVDAYSPEDAKRVAGAVAWAFAAICEEMDLPGTAILLRISDAEPVRSDGTSAGLTALLVALAGAAAAGAVILAFEYLSGAVRDARDAEAAAGVPVLASLAADAPRGVVMHEATVAAERYRMLRTSFGIATAGEPVQAVLVTAPGEGCGASAIAANFALAAAQAGRSVALIDANLRAPVLQSMLGAGEGGGLAQALSEDLALDTSALPALPGIALIAAGGAPANPSELLDSARFDRVLGELRERFDLIVIDSPPALAFTDASVLAVRCDAAIVAVRADRTERRDAAACIELIKRAGTRVLGLVVTDDPYAPGERAFAWTRAARRAFARAAAR